MKLPRQRYLIIPRDNVQSHINQAKTFLDMGGRGSRVNDPKSSGQERESESPNGGRPAIKRFYFEQFWSVNNPRMLTSGKLTRILYKKWGEVWKKYPEYYEDRLSEICEYYKRYLLNGNPKTN